MADFGDPLRASLDEVERQFADRSLATVRAWRDAHPGRPAIGHLPVYVPRELIAACDALPVAITGSGEIDIVKGDACFQSYLCHLPRSTVELGLAGDFAALDGMVFPSTCDVIRNLSGIWQTLFPDKLSFYLDLPQAFDAHGARFYREQLIALAARIERLGGSPLTAMGLTRALSQYSANRRAIAQLYRIRVNAPWLLSVDECYLLVKAGNVLPVEEHTRLLLTAADAAQRRQRHREDRIRVLLVGAFCETPPLGLLRTIERSGCYVINDDLHMNHRWIQGDIHGGDDPLEALVFAYMEKSPPSSLRYDAGLGKGDRLVAEVQDKRADGVVFAAPSFCDPALLDQPPLERALERARIPFTLFKYAENSGQFQSVREQVGTFSDSLRLWGAA